MRLKKMASDKKSIKIGVGGNFNEFKDELNSAQKAYKQTLTSMTKRATDSARTTKQAYRDLGITAVSDTEKRVKRLQQAFDVVKKSGKSSAKDIANAQKALKQRIAEVRGEVDRTSTSMSGLGSNMARFLSLAGIGGFIASTVNAARQQQQAMRGLESVARHTGQSVGDVLGSAAELSADGMMSLTEATMSLKNLLLRGFSLDQAVDMMNRLKDSATNGRAAHLGLGEAVVTATEGLKNENSTLVDNAGVTKNVSVLWSEYAESIGTTAAKLTQAQKVQAEYLGIMRETEPFVGDAERAAAGFEGQLANVRMTIRELAEDIGAQLMPALTMILKGTKELIDGGIRPLIKGYEKLGAVVGFLISLDWKDLLGGEGFDNKKRAFDETLSAIDAKYTSNPASSSGAAAGGAESSGVAASGGGSSGGNATRTKTKGGRSSLSAAREEAIKNAKPFKGNINFDPYAWRPDLLQSRADGGDNIYLTLPGYENLGPMKADSKVVGDLKNAVSRQSLKSGTRSRL